MALITIRLDDRQHKAWMEKLNCLTAACDRLTAAVASLTEPPPDFAALTTELKTSADNLNAATVAAQPTDQT